MPKQKRYFTDLEWNSYLACSIAEGFADEEPSADELHDAWQYLVDTGLCWQLQGWYGRNAAALIEAGTIQKPLKSHKDYYGNIVRGTQN